MPISTLIETKGFKFRPAFDCRIADRKVGFYNARAFLCPFVTEGATVIDIGANDGDTALPMAVLAGKTGKVICFEPNPVTYKKLLENVELNELSNTECYNFGLSKVNGKQKFVFDEAQGNGGLETRQIKIGNFPKRVELECRNLHNLSPSIKDHFRKAVYIKVDTEGSDIDILEEIYGLIRHSRPIIQVEWWIGTEKQMVKFLDSKKYFAVDKNTMQTQHNLLPKAKWEHDKEIHDLIFIPIEKLKKKIR